MGETWSVKSVLMWVQQLQVAELDPVLLFVCQRLVTAFFLYDLTVFRSHPTLQITFNVPKWSYAVSLVVSGEFIADDLVKFYVFVSSLQEKCITRARWLFLIRRIHHTV